MKDLIKDALDKAMDIVNKQVPKTKRTVRSISIDGVKPLDLPKFMKDNNVPDDCHFDYKDNGFGDFDHDIMLSWFIDIPTTDDDNLRFRIKRFNNNVAWNTVRPVLLDNGYIRVGGGSLLLREFKDTSVYEMYCISGDLDRLVRYYSIFFDKAI